MPQHLEDIVKRSENSKFNSAHGRFFTFSVTGYVQRQCASSNRRDAF